MSARQNEWRARICNMLMADLDTAPDPNAAITEAAVACMGAAAVCLGALAPEARKKVAQALCDSLRRHADKRASEIRSGQFDAQAQRHAN